MSAQKECGYVPGFCGNEVTCALASSVENQAQMGARPNPDLSESSSAAGRGAGKYWPAKRWNAFIERTKDVAQEEGCLYSATGDLEDYVNLLTGIKQREGSIVRTDQ